MEVKKITDKNTATGMVMKSTKRIDERINEFGWSFISLTVTDKTKQVSKSKNPTLQNLNNKTFLKIQNNTECSNHTYLIVSYQKIQQCYQIIQSM